MKRRISKLLSVGCIFVLTIILVSCTGNEKVKKTADGLKYIKHTNNDGPKPTVGDILYIQAKYRTDYDSVLYESAKIQDSIAVGLTDPTYKGGFEEGFQLLSAGDSATFYLQADSVFKHTFKIPLPEYIKPGSGMYLDVKLMSFE